MENTRVLKSTKWSKVKKGLLFGALLGGLLTIAIQQIVMLLGQGGENSVGLILLVVWLPIAAPTWALYRVAGWPWKVGSVYEIPMTTLILMIVINALIFALLGGAVGSFLFRRAQKKGQPR